MKSSPPERDGILAGGNWIVDRVKIVDGYPQPERLANILSESLHNGGAAFNLLTDLARLRAPFPLAGAGLIGADADGDFILGQCRDLSIDTSNLHRDAELKTSFTDVVSEQTGGRRTFFHARGANAQLGPEHFPLEQSRAKIFHLGYLLLLDRLDRLQSDGHSQAYHLLARARDLGFLTSADMVSADDARFATTVLSTLPAIDVLFLNEYEAEKCTGVLLHDDGGLDLFRMRKALSILIARGIRKWAILHFPGGACALGANGDWVFQGSVRLPADRIQGMVGAGDAFAAGVLSGIHQDRPMQESLRQGVCAAAACLTRPGSSDGILPMELCLALGEEFGFRAQPPHPVLLKEKFA